MDVWLQRCFFGSLSMAPKKGDKAKADKAEKTAKAVKANVGKKAMVQKAAELEEQHGATKKIGVVMAFFEAKVQRFG